MVFVLFCGCMVFCFFFFVSEKYFGLGEGLQNGPGKGSSKALSLPVTSLAEEACLMMLIGFDIGKMQYAAFLKRFLSTFFK